ACIQRRTHHHSPSILDVRRLRHRHIHLRTGLAIKPFVSYVTHHADNRAPSRSAEMKTLANRVLPCPVLAGHRLIYNHGPGRPRHVSRAELTATQQGNPKRLEISWTNRPVLREIENSHW